MRGCAHLSVFLKIAAQVCCIKNKSHKMDSGTRYATVQHCRSCAEQYGLDLDNIKGQVEAGGGGLKIVGRTQRANRGIIVSRTYHTNESRPQHWNLPRRLLPDPRYAKHV